MMPILWVIHFICALVHGNMAATAVGCPPPWRELQTASPFITSPPTALCLHLGEHRLAIEGGEGLGWPASLPSVVAATTVRVRVSGDLAVVKKQRGWGVFVIEQSVGIVLQTSG